MTDGAREELRELLFDGVAPPQDTDAMLAHTFAATGDDGAHLLPPDDLFDADPDPADDLALDDATLDPALLDDSIEPDAGDAADDLADPALGWSDAADATPDPSTDDAGGAPEFPLDPSGW